MYIVNTMSGIKFDFPKSKKDFDPESGTWNVERTELLLFKEENNFCVEVTLEHDIREYTIEQVDAPFGISCQIRMKEGYLTVNSKRLKLALLELCDYIAENGMEYPIRIAINRSGEGYNTHYTIREAK